VSQKSAANPSQIRSNKSAGGEKLFSLSRATRRLSAALLRQQFRKSSGDWFWRIRLILTRVEISRANR